MEVLFERICRDNGITQRRTKPRSPTTTGKIERLHKTLREEFLDHVAPFESVSTAQDGLDGWVQAYNHRRPHQALDMATPASLFRPNGPTRIDTGQAAMTSTEAASLTPSTAAKPLFVDVIEPPALMSSEVDGAAVEFEVRVPPSGEITVRSARQAISMQAVTGRVVTVWADLRSIHVLLDGQVVRTVPSRLRPEDLRHLSMRGARPASLPPPATPALRRLSGAAVLPESGAIEISRVVTRYGRVTVSGHQQLIGFAWAGRTITLRLDGHLMHAIADNALIGSWPCPVPTDLLTAVQGARPPSTALPPPPLPAGSLRAQRKVHDSGRIMVAGQRIKLGPRHRGKLVTVVIEDTHLRILHNDEEIAVRPRRNLAPITRFHVTSGGIKTASGQECHDDERTRTS